MPPKIRPQGAPASDHQQAPPPPQSVTERWAPKRLNPQQQTATGAPPAPPQSAQSPAHASHFVDPNNTYHGGHRPNYANQQQQQQSYNSPNAGGGGNFNHEQQYSNISSPDYHSHGQQQQFAPRAIDQASANYRANANPDVHRGGGLGVGLGGGGAQSQSQAHHHHNPYMTSTSSYTNAGGPNYTQGQPRSTSSNTNNNAVAVSSPQQQQLNESDASAKPEAPKKPQSLKQRGRLPEPKKKTAPTPATAGGGKLAASVGENPLGNADNSPSTSAAGHYGHSTTSPLPSDPHGGLHGGAALGNAPPSTHTPYGTVRQDSLGNANNNYQNQYDSHLTQPQQPSMLGGSGVGVPPPPPQQHQHQQPYGGGGSRSAPPPPPPQAGAVGGIPSKLAQQQPMSQQPQYPPHPQMHGRGVGGPSPYPAHYPSATDAADPSAPYNGVVDDNQNAYEEDDYYDNNNNYNNTNNNNAMPPPHHNNGAYPTDPSRPPPPPGRDYNGGNAPYPPYGNNNNRYPAAYDDGPSSNNNNNYYNDNNGYDAGNQAPPPPHQQQPYYPPHPHPSGMGHMPHQQPPMRGGQQIPPPPHQSMPMPPHRGDGNYNNNNMNMNNMNQWGHNTAVPLPPRGGNNINMGGPTGGNMPPNQYNPNYNNNNNNAAGYYNNNNYNNDYQDYADEQQAGPYPPMHPHQQHPQRPLAQDYVPSPNQQQLQQQQQQQQPRGPAVPPAPPMQTGGAFSTPPPQNIPPHQQQQNQNATKQQQGRGPAPAPAQQQQQHMLHTTTTAHQQTQAQQSVGQQSAAPLVVAPTKPTLTAAAISQHNAQQQQQQSRVSQPPPRVDPQPNLKGNLQPQQQQAAPAAKTALQLEAPRVPVVAAAIPTPSSPNNNNNAATMAGPQVPSRVSKKVQQPHQLVADTAAVPPAVSQKLLPQAAQNGPVVGNFVPPQQQAAVGLTPTNNNVNNAIIPAAADVSQQQPRVNYQSPRIDQEVLYTMKLPNAESVREYLQIKVSNDTRENRQSANGLMPHHLATRDSMINVVAEQSSSPTGTSNKKALQPELTPFSFENFGNIYHLANAIVPVVNAVHAGCAYKECKCCSQTEAAEVTPLFNGTAPINVPSSPLGANSPMFPSPAAASNSSQKQAGSAKAPTSIVNPPLLPRTYHHECEFTLKSLWESFDQPYGVPVSVSSDLYANTHSRTTTLHYSPVLAGLHLTFARDSKYIRRQQMRERLLRTRALKEGAMATNTTPVELESSDDEAGEFYDSSNIDINLDDNSDDELNQSVGSNSTFVTVNSASSEGSMSGSGPSPILARMRQNHGIAVSAMIHEQRKKICDLPEFSALKSAENRFKENNKNANVPFRSSTQFEKASQEVKEQFARRRAYIRAMKRNARRSAENIVWYSDELQPESRLPLSDQMEQLARHRYPALMRTKNTDFTFNSWIAVLWQPINNSNQALKFLAYYAIRPPRFLFEPKLKVGAVANLNVTNPEGDQTIFSPLPTPHEVISKNCTNLFCSYNANELGAVFRTDYAALSTNIWANSAHADLQKLIVDDCSAGGKAHTPAASPSSPTTKPSYASVAAAANNSKNNNAVVPSLPEFLATKSHNKLVATVPIVGLVPIASQQSGRCTYDTWFRQELTESSQSGELIPSQKTAHTFTAPLFLIFTAGNIMRQQELLSGRESVTIASFCETVSGIRLLEKPATFSSPSNNKDKSGKEIEFTNMINPCITPQLSIPTVVSGPATNSSASPSMSASAASKVKSGLSTDPHLQGLAQRYEIINSAPVTMPQMSATKCDLLVRSLASSHRLTDYETCFSRDQFVGEFLQLGK